jgi:hypothetical protein
MHCSYWFIAECEQLLPFLSIVVAKVRFCSHPCVLNSRGPVGIHHSTYVWRMYLDTQKLTRCKEDEEKCDFVHKKFLSLSFDVAVSNGCSVMMGGPSID